MLHGDGMLRTRFQELAVQCLIHSISAYCFLENISTPYGKIKTLS